MELRELSVTPADAAVFQELAGHLFYSNPALRAPQDELRRNRGSQPLLWALGVSGDWPILLATIDSADGLPTLRQLLAAHHYWRRRGMTVDLVVLNAHPPSYLQDLERQHHRRGVRLARCRDDRPAGRRLRPAADLLAADVLLMLRATARVHIAVRRAAAGPDPGDRDGRGEPLDDGDRARAPADPGAHAERPAGDPRRSGATARRASRHCSGAAVPHLASEPATRPAGAGPPPRVSTRTASAALTPGRDYESGSPATGCRRHRGPTSSPTRTAASS